MSEDDVDDLGWLRRVDEAPGEQVAIPDVVLPETEHVGGAYREPGRERDRLERLLRRDEVPLREAQDQVEIHCTAYRPVQRHGVPADDGIGDARCVEGGCDSQDEHRIDMYILLPRPPQAGPRRRHPGSELTRSI